MDDGAAGEADGGDIRLLIRQSLLAKKARTGRREETKDEGKEGREGKEGVGEDRFVVAG